MRYLTLSILGQACTSMAFPGMRVSNINPRQSLLRNLPLSSQEGNSGPIHSLDFNAADQFVDFRPGTEHQYVAPGSGDKRGPCLGLNAAANHGFLPHNGIPNIEQTVIGLGEAYSLGPEFAAALAVTAITLTRDPTAGTWPIGQSYPPELLDGQLSNPEGISNSHNEYESDASPGRKDAYLNNGDASSLDLGRFDQLYFSAENYTLDVLRDHNKYVHDISISQNPYYFSARFAGLVLPIAHHFIVNLVSNHSAENVQGYLNRDILKTFFSVSGPDDTHIWLPGQEQIPQNWYKRPSANPYGAGPAFADVAILATKYPEILRFGGNSGKVNSFVGVDPGDLTGGVFNAANLLQGNNLGCFFFNAAQQAIPAVLKGVISDLTPALALLNKNLSPVLTQLNCPALITFNQSALNQFPGVSYHLTS